MKKKISWRFKMVLLILTSVVGAIAVTWVLNRTFLEDYYLYSKEQMTGRGRGKYMYKNELRKDGEEFMREQLGKCFPNNKILYVV